MTQNQQSPKRLERLIIQILRADLNPDSERGQLIRSAGGTAVLRVGSIAIAFGASLLYARTLGPDGYGAFATVMAWTTLVALPSGLGLPQYLLRETAKQPRPVQPLQAWADKRIFMANLVAASLIVLSAFVLVTGDMRWLLVAAAPIPLLKNLGNTRRTRVQAGGWAASSQLAVRIVEPVATVAILLAVWLISGTANPQDLILATLAAALLPIGINHVLLRRIANQTSGRTYQATATAPLRVRAALPFSTLGVTDFINKRIDLIIIASMLGSHAAGIYAVVTRAAETVPLILMSSDTALAGRCARLYHKNEITKLQRLITGAARRVALVTTPFAVALMIAGGPLLEFFYGSAYHQGALTLAILVVGQLGSVWAGPNGVLLSMLGSENAATRFLLISTIFNASLNAITVPILGIVGAASATAGSAVLLNTLRGVYLRRVYGIRADIFV